MRLLIAVLLASLLGLATTGPTLAADPMECAHDASLASLHDCVLHAAEHGFIDNRGVTNSLLAKVEAAQAAVDRGQGSVAVGQLAAFMHELNAQAGKHIDADHAAMLSMHAELVITALAL
jgi:hypothetical protein